jgi:predicted ATPase/class 3 adenylate cyclase
MAALPTGTITFLFTDIEGSTKLLHDLGHGYRDVQREHFRLMREAIAEGEGREVRTEGDAFFVVFRSPVQAVRAVVAAQRALASHRWPHGGPLRVRMGLHTGEGLLGGDDYLGIDVNRAARIAAAAHGGQVLLSSATAPLVERSLPEGVSIRDLGAHRLKDFDQPEHLYQLLIEGLPRDFPALKTLDLRPTNLPTPRSSFIGRGREVAAVTDGVAASRLLTLTGPGGTGKTRLGIEAASRMLDSFPDGVFFVDLSAITDSDLVPSAVAEVLSVREQPGGTLLDATKEHLRGRDLLLVMDNFEHVVGAAPIVERLLAAAPGLRVLVTSRIPLHLSGEREVPVPPLELPDPSAVRGADALSQYEAVALFIERATALRPEFHVTNQNAPAVAELVARLDGLPLAVELAASRIKLLTPEAMLARLGQRLPLLTGGARDLPERQRTLRGAIEWSHELLEDEERRLFARLAVFAGGWTIEAAETICGKGLDVLEELGSLVDKSLVRRVDTGDAEPRFSMLETIREYAGERLAASGEEEEVRRRHARWCLDLVQEAEPHLTGEPGAWLERLDRENDNLRAAMAWLIGTGEAKTGLLLAAPLWRFWQLRGFLAEGRTWLERLLDLPDAAEPSAMRARALEALGSLAYWQNDYGPTRESYDEAERIARRLEDPALLARILWDQSYMHGIDGYWDRAEADLREGMESARAAGDEEMVALISFDMGFMLFRRGEAREALGPLLDGVAILEGLGMTSLLAENLGGVGLIEVQLGRLEEARPHLRRATELMAREGSPLRIAQMLRAAAVLAVAEGRHERAARLMGSEAHIRESVGGGAPPELLAIFGDPEPGARAALGDGAYERAQAEGAVMTLDEAVALALETTEAPTE